MPKRGFKTKPEDQVQSAKTLIGWTAEEHGSVKAKAEKHFLPFAEFVRRAALGRKAPDADYMTDVVIELSDITRAMRALHAAMVEKGLAPPEEDMLALIKDARAAMLRIER